MGRQRPFSASVFWRRWKRAACRSLAFTAIGQRRWPRADERRRLYWFALVIVGVAISAIAGASVLGAIKLVEIVDVWSHPFLHNRRYRELDARRRDELAWSLHVLPDSEGGVRVGLGVRF